MHLRLFCLLCIALMLTACATGGGYQRPIDGYSRCDTCGRVDRIERVYGQREASGLGTIAGVVIGGLLGNQIGGGDGRRAATAVGAIGGAVVGTQIERNSASAPRYELFLSMDDGRRIIVELRELGPIREGSYVQIRDRTVTLLR